MSTKKFLSIISLSLVLVIVTIMVAVITYQALPATSEAEGKLSQPTTPVTTAKATAMPVSTVAATKQPAVPTATPIITPAPLQNDEPEETDISSSDLVLIGTTDNGERVFTWGIYMEDLSKVNYVEVPVTTWDGIELVCNTSGVIAQVWGHEGNGEDRSANYHVDSDTAQNWFTTTGELKASNVRTGWNTSGTGKRDIALVNLQIVKLDDEGFCRLVISGDDAGSSSNGGSYTPPVVTEKPTVTPKPDETEKPTQVPMATSRIPNEGVSSELESWKEQDQSGTSSIGGNGNTGDTSGIGDLDAWFKEETSTSHNEESEATSSDGAVPSVGSTSSNDLDAWFKEETSTSHNGESESTSTDGAVPSIGGSESDLEITIDWGLLE